MLSHQPFDAFLDSLAAKVPSPGGGAAAGFSGALAAALARMVVSYSLGKKNLAEHQPMLEDVAKRLERARAMLLQLTDEDAQAYGLVAELKKLPETDARRQRELPAALRACVQVPLATAATCVDMLRLMQGLAGRSNPYLRSDLAIAAVLAEGAARASRWNVIINAPEIASEAERFTVLGEADALANTAAQLAAEVEQKCR